MSKILQDFYKKIKLLVLDDGNYMLLIVLFVGIGAFMLGQFSAFSKENTSVIEFNAGVESTSVQNVPLRAAVYTAQKEQQDSSAYAFVASKNGTKYYPKGCSSIQNIKEKNRIFFMTQEEAEIAGYTRTSRCK